MKIRKSTSDIVKFICAIIVVMSHIQTRINFGRIGIYISVACQIAMFAFLFLSGYGLVQSYYTNGLNQFWKKKFKKIYIPAVCVNMFETLELLVLNKIEHNRKVIFTEVLLLNSTQTKVNANLWFLHLLFIWYVCFYVIYNYVHKKEIRMLIMGGVSIIMWYIIPEIWGLANNYCLSFPVGVIYAELIKEKDFSKKITKISKIIMSALLVAGGWVMLYHSNDLDVMLFGKKVNFYVYTLSSNVAFCCGAILLCYIVGMLIGKCGFLERTASILGGMSLMIYYLHSSLVINLMDVADGVEQKVCVMFFGVTIVLLISYVYTREIGKKRGKNLIAR